MSRRRPTLVDFILWDALKESPPTEKLTAEEMELLYQKVKRELRRELLDAYVVPGIAIISSIVAIAIKLLWK